MEILRRFTEVALAFSLTTSPAAAKVLEQTFVSPSGGLGVQTGCEDQAPYFNLINYGAEGSVRVDNLTSGRSYRFSWMATSVENGGIFARGGNGRETAEDGQFFIVVQNGADYQAEITRLEGDSGTIYYRTPSCNAPRFGNNAIGNNRSMAIPAGEVYTPVIAPPFSR